MSSSIDDFPNPEQEAIIRSVLCGENRITIVRACPGSGKTKLFAEILNNIISTWTENIGGVAALSFTNVAQEEITKKLGEQLQYPHFVGTLDSFMLRYVVRPFGHLVGLNKEGPRLIPSPLDEIIENPKVRYGEKPENTGSIFRMRFVDGSENSPNMVIKDDVSNKYINIEDRYVRTVLMKKREEWKRNGRITHSDCQYLSSKILNSIKYSSYISKIIARRFPVILIDEFQDTGWFLGRAIVKLLQCSHVSGLVVGDPDQAIFEFSGAKPTLFDDVERLPGSKAYPLTRTQRCPKRVAAVVSQLSDSNASILARDDAEDGHTIMLVHGMKSNQFDNIIWSEIRNFVNDADSLAVIARRTSIVKILAGFNTDEYFKGSCRYGKQIDKAVMQLREGNSHEASKIISRVLGDFVLDDETPSAETLRKNNIELRKWRLAIFKIITAASSYSDDETWNDWLLRVKEEVGKAAQDIGWIEDKKKLGQKFQKSQKHGNAKRNLNILSEENLDCGSASTITTIHQVKGEGFDCVVLFVPKPASISPCPSNEWWKPSPCEERRVAFVAASRAKKIFILCIHLETYDALRTRFPQFVELFEVKNISGGTIPNQSSLSNFF